MATIGRTAGGRNITVGGAPYDNAAIILPNDNNTVYNITQDLTGNLTAGPQGNTDNQQTDWGNGLHILRSGNKHGQGAIPVVEGSDTDKIFYDIYNKLHPLSNSGAESGDITAAYHKYMFTLYAWKSDETDQNGNPTKYTTCEGSFFTTDPQTSLNNGTSNNETPDNWQYFCAEYSTHKGKPNVLPSLD